MLTPSGHWTWYWEEQANKLGIQLDSDLWLVTAYGEKQVTSKLNQSEGFCLSDTEVYFACFESLQNNCPYLSNAEMVQISLNACAAKKFHKLVALKSWFFDVQHDSFNGETIAIVNAHSQSKVLIAEWDSNSATCLVLDKALSLTENKVLPQFSVIKVSIDRLQRIPLVDFQEKYA